MLHVIVLFISLSLGFAFNYLFYGKALGVSWIVFVLLVLIGLAILCLNQKMRPPRMTWILVVPLLFFSSMVFVRTSPFLTFLNIAFSLYVLLLIARATHGDVLRQWVIVDYVSTLLIEPFHFIFGSFPKLLRDVLTSRRQDGTRFFASPAVKGAIMALPVIVVLAVLFASADLVFQKYLLEIFAIEISAELLGRVVVIVFVTVLFGGAYAYIFGQLRETAAALTDSKERSIGLRETSVFLWALNVFFLLFVIIQVRYLFGGTEWITSQGFTYAEYARKGFFELLVVAALTLLIIFVAEKTVYRSGEVHARQFQILSSALMAQVLIVMSSSFKRLLMYEHAYGFTLPRFYAHVILIFLAVIFLLFLYKMWVRRSESLFAGLSLIVLMLFVAGVNLTNPDLFVARHNIARHIADTSQPLDTWYLSRLSDDALPELIRVFDSESMLEKYARQEFGNSLYYRWQVNSLLPEVQSPRDQNMHWQSGHVARARARQLLSSRAQELEKYKEYDPEGLLPHLPPEVTPGEEVPPQMQRIQ